MKIVIKKPGAKDCYSLTLETGQALYCPYINGQQPCGNLCAAFSERSEAGIIHGTPGYYCYCWNRLIGATGIAETE